MNKEIMKITHEIDIDQLYFVNVPEEYKNFEIVKYGQAGTFLMEIDTKSLNHWKTFIVPGSYKILGFVKDVMPKNFETDKNYVLWKL